MPGAADGEPSLTFRAATYNVRAGIGPGPFPPAWWRHVSRERLERIGAVITGLDADVVALQEVAYLTVHGEPIDVAAELGTSTGMAWRYAAVGHFPIVEPESGAVVGAAMWGNALLSRRPIVSSLALGLPRAADDDLVEAADSGLRLAGVTYRDAPPWAREPRCALLAGIDAGAGMSVSVASVHLTHIGAGQRAMQVAVLLEALEGEGEGEVPPVILAGDLNAPLESAELEPLRHRYVDAFEAEGVPLGDPRRISGPGGARIDHLLLRGLRALDCRVVAEAGDASDHLPIVATLSV